MAAIWTFWWAWLALALVLAMIEILLPGFIFLGFAIGAVGVAVIVWLASGLGLPLLLLIFAALSLAAWLGLRRKFRLGDGQVKTFQHDIND
ncbi:NfeD family protein [Tritonibacter horizontis]|uniref:NfeD-like C-terminal domain-containing protein n=1 Tax=Tritonibacter horizontis TaxID=1768241 RepID=A0A132BV47_9RHOB|nr:hypothetical protein [Tritonibacter horizontis]KUP92255.1 hypothetical protein TRIHO_28930 [Tritonibacter horizontis]